MLVMCVLQIIKKLNYNDHDNTFGRYDVRSILQGPDSEQDWIFTWRRFPAFSSSLFLVSSPTFWVFLRNVLNLFVRDNGKRYGSKTLDLEEHKIY